jgi:glycosyltransferase involved in cell wall biosynthesis
MKVLMISTDRSILEEGSAARERMKEYGGLVDELHIIIQKSIRQLADKTQNDNAKIKISENVWAYPTNSLSRWLYIFGAYRIGASLLQPPASSLQLLTCQDPFETGLVGALLKRHFGVPLQIQIHTDFLSPSFKRQSLLNRVRVLLARFTLPRADCIRVVSERIRRSLSGVKCQMSNVVVSPIFVDAARFSARPDEEAVKTIRSRYSQFDRIILMVGRLAPEKNIALAIEAMREVVKTHPRAGLVVVGSSITEIPHIIARYKNPPEAVFARSGAERSDEAIQRNPRLLPATLLLAASALVARKDACEEPHIVFETTTRDIAPYYHAADIFLHTSNFEGYGMVLVEAAAAGLPIVTTDVGIAGDVLHDGTEALVCPVRDSACIAARLTQLLDDEALRARLGHAAQAAALRHVVRKDEYLKHLKLAWESCVALKA